MLLIEGAGSGAGGILTSTGYGSPGTGKTQSYRSLVNNQVAISIMHTINFTYIGNHLHNMLSKVHDRVDLTSSTENLN